jgi:peptidoglycan hydrolase-like protein with peptidoglycan-binding domain
VTTAGTSVATSGTTVAFPSPLSYGSTGSTVTLLQTLLHTEGFLPLTVSATGYFGTQTQHAVMLFQSAHNLPLTGSLDAQTEALLNKVVGAGGTSIVSSTPATPTTTTPSLPASSGSLTQNLAPGSTGPEVTILQHLLNQDGDYPQAIYTEYYGSLTEAAVKLFQSKEGIVSYGTPATTGYGAVGPKTRGKLDE